MRLYNYINEANETNMEDYEWLSKPKREFVKKMEDSGKFKIDVSIHTKTIKIYRDNKRTKKITQGLEIYPDGSAVDMSVRTDVAKVLRSVKDWEKIIRI